MVYVSLSDLRANMDGLADNDVVLRALAYAKKSALQQVDGQDSLERNVYPLAKSLIDYCNTMKIPVRPILVVGGLLHDSMRDAVDESNLSDFGPEISSVVMPLARTSYQSCRGTADDKHDNSYIQNILAGSLDTRLIALADRAVNLADLSRESDNPCYVRDTEELFLPWAMGTSCHFYYKIVHEIRRIRTADSNI